MFLTQLKMMNGKVKVALTELQGFLIISDPTQKNEPL